MRTKQYHLYFICILTSLLFISACKKYIENPNTQTVPETENFFCKKIQFDDQIQAPYFSIKNTAKFVEFESVYDPEQMNGQRYPVLNWPYREGLRIDEAMHPITTVVTGLYGKALPNQNGAPLRIFVPWKYGFKSAKAIVKIKLVKQMPVSSWMKSSPREYGFYSNVNPNVSHPRWSQATERVIGEGILSPRIETEMFNGYGDEVANLYSGMDLKKNF